MNTLKIAKEEILNLLNNYIVLTVVFIFSLLIIINIHDLYVNTANGVSNNDLIIQNFLTNEFGMLIFYGSFIAIVIGSSTLSQEWKGGTLNILLVKPIYRDNIITGKIIGMFIFILFIFTIVLILNTGIIIIFFGNTLNTLFFDYIIRLPIILVLSLLYTLTFLLMSILLSILIKSQTFSIITSVIIMVIFEIIPNQNFVGNIALILNIKNQESFIKIMELSPTGTLGQIFISPMFNPTINIYSSIDSIKYEIFIYLIYIVVFTVMCYIMFARRDVS